MSEQSALPHETSNSPASPPLAGLWPAFWSLLAAFFSFAAAISAFSHEGRAALMNGGIALACSLSGAMLVRWQAVRKSGAESGLARLPLATLNLLAGVVVFLAAAWLVEFSHRDRRGLDFIGDQLIWKEGVRDMALALALVFAALAAASWVLRNRPQGFARHIGAIAGVAALCTFVFGPTITFESTDGGDLEDRALFHKYSVIDMFGPDEEVRLYMDTDGEERPVICVAQESSRFLIFGTRSQTRKKTSYDEPASQHSAALCEAEVEAVMASGRAVEGLLFKGDLQAFFKRMRPAPGDMRPRMLFAHIERLPEPLRQQLDNYLPKFPNEGFTAFDVALAVGNKEEALALMPDASLLMPHQRQGLFALGATQSIAGLAGETDASLDAQHRETYQTMLGIGTQLGSVDLVRSAVASLVMSSARENEYSDFKGGYTDFDFYLANRHCDVDYAKFLLAQQHQPTTAHLLHLLSIIGLAQFPEIEKDRFSPFKYAVTSLGLPDAAQLERCEALGAFYGEHVKDFNQGDYASSVIDAYAAVYAQARGAVDEWWMRDRERQRQPASDDKALSVQGNPAIAINTAVAFLKAQPVSFEQICAWANSAYTWNSAVAKSNPEMTAAMRALSSQWRNARTMRKGFDARCELNPPYSATDDYQTSAGAIKYIDTALVQAGIPCRAKVDSSYGHVLACSAQTQPWE